MQPVVVTDSGQPTSKKNGGVLPARRFPF
jgi:hypothetical protein